MPGDDKIDELLRVGNERLKQSGEILKRYVKEDMQKLTPEMQATIKAATKGDIVERGRRARAALKNGFGVATADKPPVPSQKQPTGAQPTQPLISPYFNDNDEARRYLELKSRGQSVLAARYLDAYRNRILRRE
jgi:hypothetical protein